jgi:hypothetical protein
MPASSSNDPDHWRQRAQEMRALADGVKNEEVKRNMLRIAADYDRLAERSEEPGTDEELKAAKAAKAAIGALSITAPNSRSILSTLRKARGIAIENLSSEGALNAARVEVGIALSSVLHSRPSEEKIDKAKGALEEWINRLRGA